VTLALAVLFFLSGAAGLIYESIWSRYLGLLVGHSAYAQVIVLVIFLGGMSAGAALAARRSARLGEPLLWYAAVEALVGVLGLAFHDVFVGATGFAYDAIFPALAGGPLLSVTKWSLAGALILPQSVLLGATFPLMTAGVLRRLRGDEAALTGGVLGLFYFANSFGATIGVLLAGFWLLDLAGLPGTLVVASALNLVVAVATFGLVRLVPAVETSAAPPAEQGTAASVEEAGARGRATRLLLGVAFATAVASFLYEIAWVRMLSLVLGSATHAFELMLSAFIFGLALGALAIREEADDTRDPVRLLGLVQFAMGTLALLTIPLYLMSFDWMATLMQTVQRTDTGYSIFNVARYGFALAVMLPATVCAGMTLPLITRALLASGVGERAIGAVYAWNTLGSILGVSLAALLLMPIIGVRGVLILGGALDIAIGLWLLWGQTRATTGGRRTPMLATVAGVLVVLGAALAPGFDPVVLSSGVFRYGRVPEPGSREIVFYEHGRTASVSVQLGADSGFTIATNGKPDASLAPEWFKPAPMPADRTPLRGDNATQALIPLITLAHVPQARDGAVIGFGAGMTSHFALASPTLEWLTTIEIEPEMVAAGRLLKPANARVFDDPRSSFVFDDARSFFAASGRRFDVIFSEPSNPWVSGVAGLFTEEFYARVAAHLTPDGVFGQWLHLYEMEDDLVLGILAALGTAFPSYEIYLTNDVDALVIASTRDSLPAPDWSVLDWEDVALDLSRFRRLTPALLEATRVIGSRELRPLLDGWSGTNSDFYPVLDLHAERARFLGGEASSFASLALERIDFGAALAGRRVPALELSAAALSHGRFRAQARARLIRTGDAVVDSADGGDVLEEARLRDRRLQLELRSGAPPLNWRTWLNEVIAAERERHQGTMGVVDSAWYRDVEAYMLAQRAPAGAVSALRFLRAAVTYDWATAAAEATAQIAERDRGRVWLPPPLIFDTAVLAKLRAGDVVGARAAFVRLGNAAGRGPTELRTRLLDAHIAAAERARAPRPSNAMP
jgi:spermidine synthase